MSFTAYAINSAWMLLCRAEWKRFVKSTKRVVDSQTDYLLEILQRNRNSKFGLAHGFASIGSIDQYQRRVPFMDKTALQLAVNEMALGGTSVLTEEPKAAGPLVLE